MIYYKNLCIKIMLLFNVDMMELNSEEDQGT